MSINSDAGVFVKEANEWDGGARDGGGSTDAGAEGIYADGECDRWELSHGAG